MTALAEYHCHAIFVDFVPKFYTEDVKPMPEQKIRSTDAQDYRDLPQAIGVMSKIFADGHKTLLANMLAHVD